MVTEVDERQAEVDSMYQAGLVLEGGGMKGVYTSGVLDFFLDKDIEFSIAMECRQEHVICAAICHAREAGLMQSVWIIWMINITAVHIMY